MTFLVADGVTPVERGPRLRAAPHHPPRGPAGRADRARAAVPGRARRRRRSSRWATPTRSSREHRDEIERVLGPRRSASRETLARGLRLFEEVAADGDDLRRGRLPLHDTYGFPLELTAGARARARPAGRRGRLHAADGGAARALAQAGADVEVRVSSARRAQRVRRLREDRGADGDPRATRTAATAASRRSSSESPFYPEGGGQVTDAGFIEHEETGARAELVAATALSATTRCSPSRARASRAGDRVRAVVPWPVRFPTMANHTATHLLHKALREVLGDHVAPGRLGGAARQAALRLHAPAGADGRGARGGRAARQRDGLREPARCATYVTPIEEARKLGAMMLFGEKYGDEVRVVEIDGYSRELCGGTHVRSTAEIGPFVILSEGSVGSGRAADRGGHLRRGVRAAARRARARRDELRAELERAAGERRPRASRAAPRSVEPRSEEAIGGVNVVRRPGRATSTRTRCSTESDRIKQQRAAGGGRARRGARTAACTSSPTSTSSLEGRRRRGRGDPRGGGRGRRRRRRPADDGASRRQEPEKLGDALDAGRGGRCVAALA